jgi:hypothetical protein
MSGPSLLNGLVTLVRGVALSRVLCIETEKSRLDEPFTAFSELSDRLLDGH